MQPSHRARALLSELFRPCPGRSGVPWRGMVIPGRSRACANTIYQHLALPIYGTFIIGTYEGYYLLCSASLHARAKRQRPLTLISYAADRKSLFWMNSVQAYRVGSDQSDISTSSAAGHYIDRSHIAEPSGTTRSSSGQTLNVYRGS